MSPGLKEIRKLEIWRDKAFRSQHIFLYWIVCRNIIGTFDGKVEPKGGPKQMYTSLCIRHMVPGGFTVGILSTLFLDLTDLE